jgi:hypothetical protein
LRRARRDPESVEAIVEVENLGEGTDDRHPTKFRENAPGNISSRIMEPRIRFDVDS